MMLLKEEWMWASPCASTLTFFFFLTDLAIVVEFGGDRSLRTQKSQIVVWRLFLLVRHRLPLALSSTGVVFGALTAKGQAVTVTDASLAPDVHQAFDVLRDLGTQLAFHFKACGNGGTDGAHFVVRPSFHLFVLVNTCLRQHLCSAAASNAVDVGQCNYSALVAGDVDTSNTCHVIVI